MTDAEFATFLEDISVCFLDRNFDLWESRILRPFSLITKAGPVYASTIEDLRDNFRLYVEACEILHLDQVVRRPISIEDAGDGTFIGTYETELLSHGNRAAEPYTSSVLLIRHQGRWRMSSILGARGHHDFTGQHPKAWEA